MDAGAGAAVGEGSGRGRNTSTVTRSGGGGGAGQNQRKSVTRSTTRLSLLESHDLLTRTLADCPRRHQSHIHVWKQTYFLLVDTESSSLKAADLTPCRITQVCSAAMSYNYPRRCSTSREELLRIPPAIDSQKILDFHSVDVRRRYKVCSAVTVKVAGRASLAASPRCLPASQLSRGEVRHQKMKEWSAPGAEPA